MANLKTRIKYRQFDNICRFCLKNDFLLKPIFQECSVEKDPTEVDEWDEYADPNYEFLDIADYVCRLTDLKIEQDDPYPKFMCLTCLDVIKTMQTFQNTCRASFEVLEEVKTDYYNRKDSGAQDLDDDDDDYGLDMQISEQKYMEGFPDEEFDEANTDLYTNPAIRFDSHPKTDDDKATAEADEIESKVLDQITNELGNTHLTTEEDLDSICPDLWRAATVWSKFIINMDSIVYDDHTQYTIFVDGGLTNSEKEFSCKIRLEHDNWRKSSCESCNPAAESSMCEHILALVLNLGVVVAPKTLIPMGWK